MQKKPIFNYPYFAWIQGKASVAGTSKGFTSVNRMPPANLAINLIFLGGVTAFTLINSSIHNGPEYEGELPNT